MQDRWVQADPRATPGQAIPSPPSRKIETTLNMHLKTKKEDIELRELRLSQNHTPFD